MIAFSDLNTPERILEELGIKLIVPLEHRLLTLTTIAIPNVVNDAEVRKRLLNEYNIEIAGGLGAFKGKAWRIGVMGYSSRKESVPCCFRLFPACFIEKWI